MAAPIRWVSAVVGTPTADAEITEAFWAGVTGFGLRRDGTDPASTRLAPGSGDSYLRLVRLGRHSVRTIHLELTVKNVATAAARAEALGAKVHRESDELAQIVSPGGLGSTVVAGPRGRRPKPSRQPGGRTAVDQVSIDVPPSCLATEAAFWAGLTSWEHVDRDPTDEFSRLVRPDGMALAVLFQRLDDDQPVVTAHLDLACDDRKAETVRHERLGATVVGVHPEWTVLRDPAGRDYCITDRAPGAT
jgi:hypothetical protein